ncbi:MAG: RecX family transcriptional regulator [Alcanivoracaceae bacterium]|uniref:Regulatory protein RecX n=1 Tax=Alcanivorax profundi TaxID=2338368 RepID=A0A418Y1K6_9GAMM|nr:MULTISPECIES: regulatory protein RecX [Alcanivorax]ERP92901.1 RecX family transcriptional regulator [Alcanivorax sp. P2S70]MAX55928.1 RecX family transcriptional regulator [Alcanivoracaceae bacterium]RJG19395.1 regulatory protein RecX [Alcanivorax profundi]
MNKPLTESELRQRAVSLLARRDHARRELETKLRSKVGDHPALAAVIEWCEEHGFIDDRRFAGFFVRSRIDRGQGVLRIRQELQQRGVASELIESALQETEVDWFALAREVRARRFRQYPQDQKEKARQLRFLQGRGFDAEQSFAALVPGDEEMA